MSILLAFLAGGFGYWINRDPFTDAETYVASIGNVDRGPALSVECGASTGGKIAVRITPGFSLYSSGVPGTYSDRFRFDEAPPIELRVSYRGDVAFITGRDAERFVSGLRSSRRVVFELTDRALDGRIVRMSTLGAVDALEKLMASCPIGGTE